jgi:hypothetical protein
VTLDEVPETQSARPHAVAPSRQSAPGNGKWREHGAAALPHASLSFAAIELDALGWRYVIECLVPVV